MLEKVRGAKGSGMKVILGILLVLSISLSADTASSGDSLVIGVAPHTSARVILEMYQPLRAYLEKTLNMKVEVVTAPDFTEFARRALAGGYDIAVTTGHQARLLQTDAGYIPLLTYTAGFKSVIFIKKDGPIRSADDLKGKSALGLSASSLVTIWGQHWLKDNVGEIPVRYVSASDSVAQLVVAGDAAAGLASLANFQKLSPDIQNQLRILVESPDMAGRVYMLNSRNAAREKEIDSALWSFTETAEGKRYFEANKLEGYRKLGPHELEAMDKYTAEVRQTLR
jgi:phosphonate transport system substrate-binding protein